MHRTKKLYLPEAPARITKIDVNRLGIIAYDDDNGYPQRMLSLINACSTAKQAIELLSDYVVGQGFDNEKSGDFYKAVINQDEDNELTPDRLLSLLSLDKARFRGFAFHVNYNALYQIVSYEHVPFEQVRLGIGDNAGKYCVHADWYNTYTFGKARKLDDIAVIDKFNPDPVKIQEEVNAAGGWDKYKGQIYWYSAEGKNYPLCSIDSVLESVEAEIESDKTTKNNLKNNFQLKHIWVEKGKFEDDREKQEFVEDVQKFIGSEGKPVSVVISNNPDGKDIPELKTIQNNLNDKLFAYTDEKVRAKIYRSFRQPAILHSDYMGTNGYNEGQLPQSMEYYNNYTHPERILFEELFERVMPLFHIPINPSNDYSIVPLANIKTTESAPGTNGNNTTNI